MGPRHELPFHGSGRQVSNHIWEKIKTQDHSILISTSVSLYMLMFYLALAGTSKGWGGRRSCSLFQMIGFLVINYTGNFAFLINIINIYDSITGINADRNWE